MINDTITLFIRTLRISMRNLDVVIICCVLPVMILLAFVFLFGGAMDMGRETYTTFVVPGILVLAAGYCASLTAGSVHADMSKGVVDRFRSMPISHSAFLLAHVLASLVRSGLSTVIVIVVALLVGFDPQTGIQGWIVIALMLILYLLVITWFCVYIGLIAKSPESANAVGMVILFLPYLSSGFVEPHTLHAPLRVIAQNQPLTHIIDTIRNISLGQPAGEQLYLALIWCVGLIIIGHCASVYTFKHKFK